MTWLSAAWCWLQQLCCVHEYHLHADRHPESGEARTGKVYELCIKCGWERPGWTIDLARTMKLERKRMTAEQQRKITDMRRRRA